MFQGRAFTGGVPRNFTLSGSLKPNFLLATDLDCTLTLDNKTCSFQKPNVARLADESLGILNDRWVAMVRAYPNTPSWLCYSTGRSLELYEALVKEQTERVEKTGLSNASIMVPDVLITSDGTSIHWLKAGKENSEPILYFFFFSTCFNFFY